MLNFWIYSHIEVNFLYGKIIECSMYGAGILVESYEILSLY